MKYLYNNVLLAFFIFLIVDACQCGGQSVVPDIYNLGFDSEISFIKSIDNWNVEGCPNRISVDTLNVKFGSCSAEVNVYSSPYPEARSLHIFQTIYLPVRAKKLDVSLWLKSETFKGGYLKAYLLNANEDIVSLDSVAFRDSPDWKKYKLNIDGKSGQVLFLEINLAQNSRVWLDQLEIIVNGKPIYQYLTQVDSSKKSIVTIPNAIAMQTIDSLNISTLKDFKNKKLIGIGESVHGIHEMAMTRNQLIKYLVKNENCKLIVIEAADYFVESLNQYIQGLSQDEDIFKANDDIVKVQFYVYSEEMFQLLKWLREYNKSVVKKVVIAGMDVSDYWQKQLREFLHTYKNDDIVKKLRQFEQHSNSDSLVVEVSKDKTHLISVLNEDRYNYLSKLAEKFNQFGLVYRTSFNNRGRDSVMAENVKTLVEKYTNSDEKAIICGHLAHLNKLNLYGSLTPSMGKRLSDYYKDNYFVIAQLVGNGKYQAFQINPDSLNINLLNSPTVGSVEEVCTRIPLESYYVSIKPCSIFKDGLMMFRKIGGIPQKNQFYAGNLYRRIDAIVFMQNGTPLLFFQNKLKECYQNRLKEYNTIKRK